jgi:alkylhydroperoxidase/carboxymuconolactone decarboxylase family protein YurZ
MPEDTEPRGSGRDDDLIEEIASYYGGGLAAAEEYRLLARHAPEFVDGYLRMRRALFGDGARTALDPKVRELVTIAILVALKKTNPPPISHTRKALEHGATPAEIAEVLALCILLGGMVTYRESGRFVMHEAADERADGGTG